MTNPAPYFIAEKTIATIDGKRIETYSPGFVKVLDTTLHGDAPSDCYNSIVRPSADFAGHPDIDAYIAEMNAKQEEYHRNLPNIRKNASFRAR